MDAAGGVIETLGVRLKAKRCVCWLCKADVDTVQVRFLVDCLRLPKLPLANLRGKRFYFDSAT